MAEVVLEKVTKVYPGGVKAVDAIDLTIADREFIVLVGPSGCGKSTTLRMVAGLEDITHGTIRIGQRVVNGVAPKDRDIAMVFQNYALYPHMTVYKNMAFGLMMRRKHRGWGRQSREERKRIDQRVRQTAAMLGIEELLERRPKALSGGQRQRVAVGRAIVREPKAFLFDEPLSNLDAKLRVEMRAEIKRLHRRVETTTIYVTHDQEEAMTLGDRIVVMKDGLIHQCAPPLEVYERPANRFVAGFVGTPPMNFLEGRVVSRNGRLHFDVADATVAVSDVHQAPLAAYVDRPLILGIRPEAMHVQPAAAASDTLPASVSVTEPLGDRMDVHVSTAHHPHLVCRVAARTRIEEGARVNVEMDMDRAHFFEVDGAGRNIVVSV